MSRKYLYFKLFRDLEDTIESEILSEYEITAYFDDFEIIQNVFQLYQNTELKLLINRSRQLQNLLTKSLPRHGYRHGYLWSGEHFPDFTRLLSGCGLIEECIAFQKVTDPLPEFRLNSIYNLKRQFEIYNWYVYHFRSFQYYYGKSSKISLVSESEMDIDWAFESLWEKQRRIEDVEDLPVFETEEPPVFQSTLNYINPDKRAYTKSQNKSWIRSILNHINPSSGGMLYIPFADGGELIIEALFNGQTITASEINPIKHHYLSGYDQIYESNLIQLSQAISDIISQLKMIIINQSQVQVDLFVNSAEKQFQQFWQTERERIKLIEHQNIADSNLRVISAIRFLIDTKSISRSEHINILLMNGLINLTAGLLRKKNINDVISAYKKELRRLYLDIYIFHKVRQLNPNHGHIQDIYLQNVLSAKSIKDESIDAICCFFPSNINKKGFRDDQVIIDILNLHPNPADLEKYKLGLKKRNNEKLDHWNIEIINDGSQFAFLGNYGCNILTHLHNAGRQAEAGMYLKLWIDANCFLHECSRILKKDGNICLIVKNPSIKISEEVEEIKTSEVFKELVEKTENDIQLKITKSMHKPDQKNNFGKTDFHYILLLSKC